ncbi:hypothetical protein [Vibrio splendidus]|nr:hypothetical protein [Vibrio splendidus]
MDIEKLVWPPKEKCRMDATFFVSGVYEKSTQRLLRFAKIDGL